MRTGVIEDASSPHVLVSGLPSLYHEDDFSQRLLSAFDEVLAPATLAIEGVPAYLDPQLTPDDFLDWLAGWVGVLLDENWPIERRRAFVARAADLYRLRGTVAGLSEHVGIFTGGIVEVEDSGAVVWADVNGTRAPGLPGYTVRVRVSGADGPIDQTRLDMLVRTAKPAHVVHSVEVVSGSA